MCIHITVPKIQNMSRKVQSAVERQGGSARCDISKRPSSMMGSPMSTTNKSK